MHVEIKPNPLHVKPIETMEMRFCKTNLVNSSVQLWNHCFLDLLLAELPVFL